MKQENVRLWGVEGGEGDWHLRREGRGLKGRFHFEFRPDPRQKKAEFKAGTLGLGERKELSTVERGTD